jgi:phosphoglycerate kinase
MLFEKYKIRTLSEIEKDLVKVENAIVRVDFNITIVEKKITDPTRILASLPTIQFLVDRKIQPILISHLGENLSFEPVLEEISLLLGSPLTLARNLEALEKLLAYQKNNNPILLDNIRFNPGEINKDPNLAKNLAKISPLYINDAFSVCHRDHTSVTVLSRMMQLKAAGFSLKDELENLERLFGNLQKTGKKRTESGRLLG